MVNQLVQQLINLNRSTHPDLVNCYRANFSLLMKLSKFNELCQQITEPTLYKVLDQLLRLLTEHRFETMDKHEMFIKVVNCLIIHLLESTNKTNIFCALIRILYDTVNNSDASNHFRELVVKCIWKLNRSQAEWDSELNYPRLLAEIHLFLKVTFYFWKCFNLKLRLIALRCTKIFL
ncbi:hypothetical protein AAG570_012660 [Ranatra chinensis]|uniref:Uncharacterized protein n=1 Tax=Ranatra chinensis TaxID=642074 RepID=A0ABD0YEH2_9HEMI